MQVFYNRFGKRDVNNRLEYTHAQFFDEGFLMSFKFPSWYQTFRNRYSANDYERSLYAGQIELGVHAPASQDGYQRRLQLYPKLDGSNIDLWDQIQLFFRGNLTRQTNSYDDSPQNPYLLFDMLLGYGATKDIMMTEWLWYVKFVWPSVETKQYAAYLPAPAARNLNFSFSNAGCSLSWQHPPLFRAKQYIVSFYESDNSLTKGPLKAVRQSITQLNTFLPLSTIPGSFYTAEIASVDYNNQISANTPPVTVRYQVPPTPITNVRLVQNRLNEFNSFTSLSWSGGVSNRTTNTAEFYFATNSTSEYYIANRILNASSNPGRYLFGRAPGYFYRARVIAQNDFGSVTSTFSNILVTTPSGPSSPVIASLTSQGIVPTWVNVPGNALYQVYVYTSNTINIYEHAFFTSTRNTVKSGDLIPFTPIVGNYYGIVVGAETADGLSEYNLYSNSEFSPVRRYVTQTTTINHITLRALSEVGATVNYFNLVNQNFNNVSSSENTLQIFASPNASYNNLSLVRTFPNVNTNQSINFAFSRGMFYTAQLVYTDDSSGSKISPYSSFSSFSPANLDPPIVFSLTAKNVMVQYPIMPGNTYSLNLYEEQSSYSSSNTLRSSRQRLGIRMTSSPFSIPFDTGLVGGGTFLDGLYPTAWYYALVTMTNAIGTRTSVLSPTMQRLQYMAPPTTASFLQLASLTRDNLFVTWSGVMGADTIQVNLFQSSDILNANTPTHSSYTYSTTDLRKPTNFVTILPIPYNNSQSLAISVSNRLPAGNYGVNLIARNNFGSYTSFFSPQRFLN